MFTGGLMESEMNRIKLQGVCPTAMARLLNYIYTGRIRVTEVTVCSILSVATMFQVRNDKNHLVIVKLKNKNCF